MSYMNDPRLAQYLAAEHRDREIAALQARHLVQITRQTRRQARLAEQIARQAALYEQNPGLAVEWLPKPAHQHTDSVFVLVRRVTDFIRNLAGHGGRTPGVQAR
ncbi:hypothetical protein ACFWQC_09675 [Nocardioides sp. NPDC058538]|uniref:hypothetical protein n=1 Tax=Nocardioides sp. NPDC058538 TaxID=3346542 RepID=UPI0036545FFF